MSPKTLPLFPDLIEQAAPSIDHADVVARGYGAWCVSPTFRRRRNGRVSYKYVSLYYDDERYDPKPTGRRWVVVLKTYWSVDIEEVKGWGNSRTKKKRLATRYNETWKRFDTRELAIEFAERLIAIMNRLLLETEEFFEDVEDDEE